MDPKGPPSAIIKAGIVAVGISYLLGVGKLAYLAATRGKFQLEHPADAVLPIIVLLFLCVLVQLLMRGLYLGSKIAFWLVVIPAILAGIGFGRLMKTYTEFHDPWECVLYVGQGVLQMFSAIAMLLPASIRWFFNKPTDERSSTPPSLDL